MSDFELGDAFRWAYNETLGTNDEGEQNALSIGGVLSNAPYELIPNVAVRYTAMTINDVAFGTAYQASGLSDNAAL